MEDITIRWEQRWADDLRCEGEAKADILPEAVDPLIMWDQYYIDKYDKECDNFDDLLGAVNLTLLGTQGAIL